MDGFPVLEDFDRRILGTFTKSARGPGNVIETQEHKGDFKEW